MVLLTAVLPATGLPAPDAPAAAGPLEEGRAVPSLLLPAGHRASMRALSAAGGEASKPTHKNSNVPDSS